MAKGPLAVRWLDWTLEQPRAGAVSVARVGFENTGTVTWREGIRLGYHWLDERGNPLVWDGHRTELPELSPGERASIDARVRAPLPPGRYRFALDMVAERRAWFSELGGDQAVSTVDVLPRPGEPRAELPHRQRGVPHIRQRTQRFQRCDNRLFFQQGGFRLQTAQKSGNARRDLPLRSRVRRRR